MQFVDLSAYRCPMAFVQAKLAMKDLGQDQALELLISDPATLRDLIPYARRCGFSVESDTRPQGTAVYLRPHY
ncbi:sulfurtransferase TusA family protein [Ferrimonas futtsuensis]|uniref:sulfurtransferase TusA family protein n=1 Tax=Ferrimonas futtsuensis TaxID=364764 RepID=UPI00040A618A|nr:sulfurtransferase TusA family protein [Ferrimonas futtsuensis]